MTSFTYIFDWWKLRDRLLSFWDAQHEMQDSKMFSRFFWVQLARKKLDDHNDTWLLIIGFKSQKDDLHNDNAAEQFVSQNF